MKRCFTPAGHLLHIATLIFASLVQAEDGFEETFDDADAISEAWTSSFNEGSATLVVADGVLEFRVPDGDEKAFDYLYYKAGRLRYNESWAIEADVFNDGIPEASGQLISLGLEIYDAKNLANRMSAALSVSRIEGFFSRVIYTQIVEGGDTVGSTFSEPVPTDVSIRIAYDADERTLTTYFRHLDLEDPETWIEVGSFGLAGKNGETEDARWKMRGSNRFLIYLYGYTENLEILSGDAYVEAFRANP